MSSLPRPKPTFVPLKRLFFVEGERRLSCSMIGFSSLCLGAEGAALAMLPRGRTAKGLHLSAVFAKSALMYSSKIVRRREVSLSPSPAIVGPMRLLTSRSVRSLLEMASKQRKRKNVRRGRQKYKIVRALEQIDNYCDRIRTAMSTMIAE